MGKRKRDEDSETIADGATRDGVKKVAFEKSMIEHEVNEALAYEQFIKAEVASKELMISQRWIKLGQWSIWAPWMMWEVESSAADNYLLMIRDELFMEEEFEKDRMLIEEAFVRGDLPGWDYRDVVNYLLQYLSEMDSTTDWNWHWFSEAVLVGEEYLTEEQWLAKRRKRVEREQDLKSIEDAKMEKLILMQEEVIMDERLMMHELWIASEELMANQQDTIDEEWIDYEQSIKDKMMVDQVGWHIMAFPKDEQPTTFNYTPLSQPKDEIRLVRLHPGNRRRESPLVCDLITVDLRSAPVYEALSYEWGSPSSKKHTIRLNDRLFSLREISGRPCTISAIHEDQKLSGLMRSASTKPVSVRGIVKCREWGISTRKPPGL